ncbi:amino acid permease [Bifidobacterium aquikefiri]|uniref:amino acid permease n=1 Tax=Bifidobacterium aquikefiri TaxID=1653207 RepID=UPI0039EB0B31
MAQTQPTINKDGTHRSLSNRHVQMIAIGGTIGTGLFLGAGTTISQTGPSVLLVYLILGLFFFLMMRGIGEMLYADPSQHTFVAYIAKYLGRRTGQFAGWTYWLGLVFLSMAELTAIGNYVQFWLPQVPAWLIELCVLVVLVLLNLSTARLFGETEFWFAMIKIAAIIALIVTGIVMTINHAATPLGHASVSNLFIDLHAFPKGFMAFAAAFPMVFFAFQGIEFISITIGEAKSPRKIIRKAVNNTLIRILLFYVFSLVVIMMIVPWKSIQPDKSPFVQVFQLAGLPAAAAIINAVVLTAAASALNSSIFSAGRHLYQIATESEGNNGFNGFLAQISRNGIPAHGIVISGMLMLLAPFISMFRGVGGAFTIVTGISSDLYIVVYILAMLAHRKYRRSADFMPSGFVMPAYSITSPVSIAFFGLIFLSLFVMPDDRTGAFGAIVWCLIFIIFYAFQARHDRHSPGMKAIPGHKPTD